MKLARNPISTLLTVVFTAAACTGMHAQEIQAAPAASTLQTQPTAAVASIKPAGKLRIGVVFPTAQLTQSPTGTDPSEALRASLISYMSGPAVDIVPIDARLQSQIDAEAKDKQCDFILYSSLTQKHGGGGLGSLMKGGSSLMSMVPMVGMAGGMAGMIAGQTASVAAGAVLSGSVKAKDEVSFEYRLLPLGTAQPLIAKSERAKAKSNGDDVITPMVQHAAEAVLTAVKK